MASYSSYQDPSSHLEQLTAAVLASAKYGQVDGGLVRAIGAAELAKQRSLKEAIKATKNRLHQVAGAYLGGRMHYPEWLEELRRAYRTESGPEFQAACQEIMSHHASTRERLPILERFYATVLADLPPIRSILDVACGLNPLAWPWMPVAPGAAYHAYDVYADMVRFLNGFLDLIALPGEATVWDVVHRPPPQAADLALILKAIPCLEQIDPQAGTRLLDSIDAPFLVVSFPVRSLGGRQKGMQASYEFRFQEMVAGRHWSVRRFDFETELVFRIDR